MQPRLALFALPFALIACAGSDDRDFAPEPETPGVDACGAAELQDLVGSPRATVDAITFAVPTRVILPGMAVTMDFSPSRLNIELDEDGTIARIYCG